jgi:inner membrane protein
MDNLCHTLVGAAIGETGLKRRTAYGSVALMVGANLPDVDALVFLTGSSTVAFRRGWTHGVPAQLLLPIVMAAAFVWFDRRAARRGGRPPRAHPGMLLLFGYIGVFSHVFLDYLNVYGVRLLMPLDGRWFYGDALFIIDPWLWLALGAGVLFARRGGTPAPAVASLAIAAAYIAVMMWLAGAARHIVLDAWTEARGEPPRALMVGPVPIHPLNKEIIVDAGDHYVTGTFGWWPRRVRFGPALPKNESAPAARAAREDPRIRSILVWARFPYYRLTQTAEGTEVTLEDARYGTRVGSATVMVKQ